MIDCEKLLKQWRKTPLANLSEMQKNLSYGKEEIKKLIPHREPFLLIDNINDVDLNNELIIGSSFISKDNPVFLGHFPGFPIYPGSLQIEMIGQLGLCLTYFLHNHTTLINSNVKPVNVRATKILGAAFLEPVLPDKNVQLIVKKLEQDSYFGRVIGQVILENKICTVSMSEVIFLD